MNATETLPPAESPVEWAEPPEKGAGRPSKYDAAKAELRANPGKWGIVGEGKSKADLGSGFESVARGGKIYARYTGLGV